MELAELIDLESQLLRDEAVLAEGDGRKLLDRDRTVGIQVLRSLSVEGAEARERLVRDTGFRRALASRWLAILRKKVKPLPGRRIYRGYRLVGWVLAVVAIFLGVGSASAALTSDGAQPVNVFYFLSIFVGLQMILLVAMVAMMVLRSALGASALVGWAQSFMMWLSQARWVDRLLQGKPSPDLAGLSRMRVRSAPYAGVERWMLFSMTQRCGVLFNLTALVTCLALITSTDLTFSWSTTLDLSGDELHGLLEAVAAPWSWAVEGTVPDVSVIARSEWVRHPVPEFRVGSTADEARAWAGPWWRFLVLALAFWGLLPRLLAYGFASLRMRRALARVDLGHGPCQRLFERLLPPVAGWESPDPEDVRSAAARGAPKSRGRRASRGSSSRSEPEAPAGVVVWGSLARHGDVLPALVRSRFQWEVTDECRAAGGADLSDDAETVAALSRSGTDRVVLVVEAGVQPTKEIIRFVRELRDGLGARAQLVIGIVLHGSGGWAAPAADELFQWQERMESLGDPYLRVEGLGDGA